MSSIIMTIGFLFVKNMEQGAATTVFACISKDLKGGEYLSDCRVVTPSELARNVEEQVKLWKFSETNAKINYSESIKI